MLNISDEEVINQIKEKFDNGERKFNVNTSSSLPTDEWMRFKNLLNQFLENTDYYIEREIQTFPPYYLISDGRNKIFSDKKRRFYSSPSSSSTSSSSTSSSSSFVPILLELQELISSLSSIEKVTDNTDNKEDLDYIKKQYISSIDDVNKILKLIKKLK